MGMRFKTIVLFALGSFGLAGCPGPATAIDHARQTAQEFNAQLRYGAPEEVLDRVAATARTEFTSRHRAWGSDVRIADVEMTGVRAKGERDALVSVRVAWYRPEEQLLRTTTVEQTWREGSGWQLLSEKRLDGDVGLLGEKVVYVVPYDQGPPPQFKTVHLAGDPSP
jgi:hypothetical protein